MQGLTRYAKILLNYILFAHENNLTIMTIELEWHLKDVLYAKVEGQEGANPDNILVAEKNKVRNERHDRTTAENTDQHLPFVPLFC